MASEQTRSSINGDGGYVCKFVDESQPDGLFKCRICTLVLRDPHITECCGENACHHCIVKVAENDGPCPIPGCRSKNVKINLNRDLRSIILESDVYCQSKEAGCEWVGNLDKLSKHLKEECPFVEEECQQNCGVCIQRRRIKDHEKVCECLPVECEKCGKVYKRHCHSMHIKACPFTAVKCPFSIVGCKYEVQNKNLQQHFDESISEHSTLVAKQSQEVQTQIRETKLITEQQRREKLDCYVTEADTISDELTIAQEKVTKLKRKLEEAKRRHEELKQRHNQIKLELESQKDQKSATFQVISEDLKSLVSVSKVKCYGPALPKLESHEIVSRPVHSPMTMDENVPPVTFMIHNFNTERKNDARIYLRPFYTHRGGYKLCMIVCCNGDHVAKYEWLSVYVSVLKGRYDTYLQWPLNCTVHFRIRTADNEYLRTIDVLSRARVLDDCDFACTYSNTPGSQPQYTLALGDLKRLQGGCLLIKVNRVCSLQD